MMATPSALATTAADLLLVLLIVVPVAGVLLAFALGDRYVRRVAFTVIPVGLAISGSVLLALPQNDGHMVYLLGAWPPPLGVALRADGLSAVMLAATAIVVCAVAIFAAADFRLAAGYGRAPFAFWILLLAVWAALNTIFVGGDLFTLYVALELLTFAAVPLVSLEGQAETLQAALRYLLFALVGSVLYLMGTALLYGLYGTLDIVLLSHRVSTEPGALIAAALMTTGLLAKTALFPLHLWLPPAHAGAPAAASAILSGLVVKGSFFILLRVWFNVLPGVPGFAAAQFLAALGAGRDRGRKHRRPAAGAPQAARRIFDNGPDRVPFPAVSTRSRCLRTARNGTGPGGRIDAGDLPRRRESGNVPGSRVDLRRTGP
ncbi:formate hydrogenlyase subunit 3/multisubunit Na+/H+ antiporter MnhD subunit [Bradyrhizobium sp. LB7.1]